MTIDHLSLLNDIIRTTARSEPFGQRGLYQPVADKLNKVSGKGWSWEYIRNIHHGEKIRPVMAAAIEKVYRSQKTKPGPNDIAKRTVVYYCTQPEQNRLREEKDPRERTIKTLRALKEI